jgi:putative SOS response-associated peptidase YedK
MVPRLWGVLPPPNSDDPMRRIATLRNPESPFWIGNLRNSEFRCLIPASSVMVWGSDTDYEGRRLRHWIGLENAPLFAMLGVWKDEEIPAFALLTREATGLARDLGAATSPFIIPASGPEAQVWLHGGWDRARQLVERPARLPLVEVPAPSR